MRLSTRVWLRAGLLSLVAQLAPAHAFKLDDTGHGGITRDALAQTSITIGTVTLKFSDRAKEEIKAANFETDKPVNQVRPAFHFDSEAVAGGLTRVKSLKEDVIAKATGGNGKDAKKALGAALHTIQDFFAHSSQTDLGLAIPNFGVDVSATSPSVVTCGGILFPGSVLLPNAGLTTGYFHLDDLCFQKDIPPTPHTKCNHGLSICPGIAKDPEDHPFHKVAYDNAVTASSNFIMSILKDPRMAADSKAIKRLMGTPAMIGAVIDDTASMESEVGGVIFAVRSIVGSVIGTSDEPDRYLVETFNDPTVSEPITYNDAGSFLLDLNLIHPNGGGDCPELSMYGTYKALVAADNGSRLFIFTDASAKDAGLRSVVTNLAMSKRIQLITMLSGSCSPYDETYFELARKTGGQVFITMKREPDTTLTNLIKPLVRNDVALILQASLNLTGGLTVTSAPIDDTVKQATFSVGMITKGSIAVRRPNGAVVQATDAGVTITDTVGSRTVTVNAPEPGDWKIEVTGTGTTLVTAAADTPAALHKFEFANMAGRTGHQGLFPIDGYPIIGKLQTARAIVFGLANISEFSFRNPDGTMINRFTMSNNSPLGATKEEFVGEVIPPLGPFLISASGTTSAGQRFQRVLPGQRIASIVEVRSASSLTSVPAGRTTAVAFSITNYGNPATFALSTVDSRNFLTTPGPAPVTLNTDESRTVTVNVSPPASTVPGTEFAVTLTAGGGADNNSNSASILFTVDMIDTGNRDPVCSAASANPAVIRKMNHEMVPVSIVGVADADNDPVETRITAITQDEPVTGGGSGNTTSDAVGVGSSSALVRAERSGKGDGRVYRIAFDAFDGKGGQCSGAGAVEVPHDNRISAPDSGTGFNSVGIR
jgi:hypothetical protein